MATWLLWLKFAVCVGLIGLAGPALTRILREASSGGRAWRRALNSQYSIDQA